MRAHLKLVAVRLFDERLDLLKAVGRDLLHGVIAPGVILVIHVPLGETDLDPVGAPPHAAADDFPHGFDTVGKHVQ